MEGMKKKLKREQEIVYSKAIKAGKRIYYLDVKKNKNDDLFLAITESKKKICGEDAQIYFEKHKIFIDKEDFEKFKEGIEDVTNFIYQYYENAEMISEEMYGNENTVLVGEQDKINTFEIEF
jgi:hypothetical protein